MGDAPELKPCPFCGGEAKIIILGFSNAPVVCGDNWCCQSTTATVWNTRADLSNAKDARIAELEALNAELVEALVKLAREPIQGELLEKAIMRRMEIATEAIAKAKVTQ